MSTPSVVICTPMRDESSVSLGYVHAVRNNVPEGSIVICVAGVAVDKARNEICRTVVAMQPHPEYMCFVDDDCFFLPGTIERLIGNLETLPRTSVLAAWFCMRITTNDAVAFQRVGPGVRTVRPVAQSKHPLGSQPDLEKVDFIGMHLVVFRTDLLDDLPINPFEVSDSMFGTEDLQFCARVRAIGAAIYVDRTLPCWHEAEAIVDGKKELIAYTPGARPSRIVDGVIHPMSFGSVQSKLGRSYGTTVDSKFKDGGFDLLPSGNGLAIVA